MSRSLVPAPPEGDPSSTPPAAAPSRLGLSLSCLLSLLAMLYDGAYQVRLVGHLACPAFRGGCAWMSDSPFAHRFGVPDALLAAALYGVLFAVLAFLPTTRARTVLALMVASVLLLWSFANMLKMMDGNHFSFWRLVTAGFTVSLFFALLPRSPPSPG